MAFARSAVGIDLGARNIRVVHVAVSESGVTVLGALRLARESLRAEGIADDDPAALAAVLARAMRAARIPTKGVVLGLSGSDAVIRYTRTPPVPAFRLQVIMDYEVREFGERLGEPLASDFRTLPLPREIDEDQTVLIAHSKETPLTALLDALEAEGITIERAVPSAIALYNLHDALGKKADKDSPDDDLVLLADLGEQTLEVALVLNDRPVFARSVTFGGKNFTEALRSALGVDQAKAEKLKTSRCGLEEEPGILLDGVGPLRNQAGQLLSTLQSSLGFCTKQTGARLPSLSRVALLGGGMRLRGLANFLKQGLRTSSEFFRPPKMESGGVADEALRRELSSQPSDFGVALGLAVTGIRYAGPAQDAIGSLNVLPSKYLARREFRERTRFLYVAAALLVFLLLAQFAYGYYQNSSAVGVRDRLRAQHRELSLAETEMEENATLADAGRSRLNQLLREAEQTAFQAFVLDFLGRNLRPEIQISEVRWDVRPPAEEGGIDEYVLQLDGRVNNEKRHGLEYVLELQNLLQSEDRIRAVEEGESQPERGWYLFQLTLLPNYVRY